MSRLSIGDMGRLGEAALEEPHLLGALARAIRDLQDQMGRLGDPEPMTATKITMQTENYLLNRRIEDYEKEVTDLRAKLRKATEGWEKAGREAALNLARAEAAEDRLRRISFTEWHPL